LTPEGASHRPIRAGTRSTAAALWAWYFAWLDGSTETRWPPIIGRCQSSNGVVLVLDDNGHPQHLHLVECATSARTPLATTLSNGDSEVNAEFADSRNVYGRGIGVALIEAASNILISIKGSSRSRLCVSKQSFVPGIPAPVTSTATAAHRRPDRRRTASIHRPSLHENF